MKVAASWSGGKDSCLACWYALAQGYEVRYLMNFISREFGRVSFHGTRARLISQQAGAVAIPLTQYSVPPDMAQYEKTFKRAVSTLKRKGVQGIVFGDIYLQEHKDWIDRVCREIDVFPITPLWDMVPRQVLREFIGAGFEAVVVSANADIFTEEWLGRRIDNRFLSDLEKLATGREVDVCGEHGEYHSLVVDGPLFRRRMEVTYGVTVQRNGYWLLDIPRCRLRLK